MGPAPVQGDKNHKEESASHHCLAPALQCERLKSVRKTDRRPASPDAISIRSRVWPAKQSPCIDLVVKLFHILRKRQSGTQRFTTILHQILHHLMSAETLHLLLNPSKYCIQHLFEETVDTLKKLKYKFDISERIVHSFWELSTPI